MTTVKICGLTTLDDALVAVEAGADYLGFIFAEGTPRYIDPAAYERLAAKLPETAKRVGVFVNGDPSLIARLVANHLVDYVQLHGTESPDYVRTLPNSYKVLRPKTSDELGGLLAQYADSVQPFDALKPAYLLDAYHPTLYGGTGHTVSRQLFMEAQTDVPRLMLAGGLTPDNIAEIVREVKPFAVDVSSGVEATPGRKDHAKVRAFIAGVRDVQGETK